MRGSCKSMYGDYFRKLRYSMQKRKFGVIICTFQKHLKDYWYCKATWREKVHTSKGFIMQDFKLEGSTAWKSGNQYKEVPEFKYFEGVFKEFMIDTEDKYRHIYGEKLTAP